MWIKVVLIVSLTEQPLRRCLPLYNPISRIVAILIFEDVIEMGVSILADIRFRLYRLLLEAEPLSMPWRSGVNIQKVTVFFFRYATSLNLKYEVNTYHRCLPASELNTEPPMHLCNEATPFRRPPEINKQRLDLIGVDGRIPLSDTHVPSRVFTG